MRNLPFSFVEVVDTIRMNVPSITLGMQRKGCLSYRRPSDSERYIYVDDDKSVEVEAIGNFRLLLKTSCYLKLNETYVVPSFRPNLVSICVLDKFGYYCLFGNSKFSLFQDSNRIGIGSLSFDDKLYLFDTVVSFNETLHISSRGTK